MSYCLILKKKGGHLILQSRANKFREYLDYCDLIDLGFNGPTFTWTNQREVWGLIQERLDRAIANQRWILKFPSASLLHLPRNLASDHCPILLTTFP